MDHNTLFQSLDRKTVLSEDAKIISASLDVITSRIVGRLVSERLIDYAGQPGQTIEYLASCIADEMLASLDKVDTVEMQRFFERGK